MSWKDFDTPTVEEIKNHSNASALIKSHVKKYECPECGHENLVTYSDGWNNSYSCNKCGDSFKYIG